MRDRLRLSRIEARKKTVRFIQGHNETVPLSEAQRETVLLIRRRIEAGHELPPYCYRVNRDSSPDALLEREGIMHLHLSPVERNATLFLIQYSEDVVFLGINDHAAFRDDPPGSSLYELHRHAIARTEAAIAIEEANESHRRRTAIAAGLKPRRKPSEPR